MFRTASVFVLLIVIASSCKSSKHSVKRLPGIWQASPIVIDGKNNDWPSPYTEYDEKAMLGYMVSNDKENLYITCETGDLATQLKILREGLTVWIDRKGEKGEETAINYPIPIKYGKGEEDKADRDRPQHQRAQPGQGGAQDRQQMRIALEDKVQSALAQAKEYSLQGFRSCNLQYPILEKDSCGIVVRMSLDADNELIWEAVIPFKAFYFKPEITRADKGKPISICFETTGEDRPAGAGGGGRGPGVRPSMGFGPYGGLGMGMQMGGGYGRGRYNSTAQQDNIMESLYKSTKTYKKFGIAFQ